MKKIFLILSLILLLAAGALYFLKGKSAYDPAKYSLEIRPADKPFGIGSEISFVLPDQFGKSHSLSPETRTMIFAFTKETGHLIKTAMAQQSKGFLQEHKAVIVADISAMPTVIQNLFALPDLRKSDYTMLLIYDKKMARRLKEGQKTDQVIVVRLKRGKVTAVEHAKSPEELIKLISQA
ncbi:hypothetical protein [Nitratifractor sp.]